MNYFFDFAFLRFYDCRYIINAVAPRGFHAFLNYRYFIIRLIRKLLTTGRNFTRDPTVTWEINEKQAFYRAIWVFFTVCGVLGGQNNCNFCLETRFKQKNELK